MRALQVSCAPSVLHVLRCVRGRSVRGPREAYLVWQAPHAGATGTVVAAAAVHAMWARKPARTAEAVAVDSVLEWCVCERPRAVRAERGPWRREAPARLCRAATRGAGEPQDDE